MNRQGKDKFVAPVIVSILLSIPLTGIAVNVYAPLLPDLRSAFNMTEAMTKLTVTTFLFGIALGQYLFATLADSLGRRKLKLSCILFFIIISILITFVSLPFSVNLLRFIQGIFSGAIVSITRAQVSDYYNGEKLRLVAALISITNGVGLIVSPIVGSYLQHLFSWKFCFYFLSIYGLFMLLSEIIFTREKQAPEQKFPLQVNQLLANYLLILTNLDYISMLLMASISYAIFLLFSMIGPYYIHIKMGFSLITYGHIALFVGVAYLLGGLVSASILRKFIDIKIIRLTCFISLFSSILLLLLSFIPNILLLVPINILLISVFINSMAAGIVYPICLSYCIGKFPYIAGTSSAITGSIMIVITALVSLIIALIHINTLSQFMFVYMALITLNILLSLRQYLW